MVRRGFLERYEAGFMKSSWKSRWFILSDNCLYMFDGPEDEGNRVKSSERFERCWLSSERYA
jgi:hypothetical protein